MIEVRLSESECSGFESSGDDEKADCCDDGLSTCRAWRLLYEMCSSFHRPSDGLRPGFCRGIRYHGITRAVVPEFAHALDEMACTVDLWHWLCCLLDVMVAPDGKGRMRSDITLIICMSFWSNLEARHSVSGCRQAIEAYEGFAEPRDGHGDSAGRRHWCLARRMWIHPSNRAITADHPESLSVAPERADFAEEKLENVGLGRMKRC